MHQTRNIILFLLNTFNSFYQSSSSNWQCCPSCPSSSISANFITLQPGSATPKFNPRLLLFHQLSINHSAPYRDTPFHISPALITPLIPTRRRKKSFSVFPTTYCLLKLPEVLKKPNMLLVLVMFTDCRWRYCCCVSPAKMIYWLSEETVVVVSLQQG